MWTRVYIYALEIICHMLHATLDSFIKTTWSMVLPSV